MRVCGLREEEALLPKTRGHATTSISQPSAARSNLFQASFPRPASPFPAPSFPADWARWAGGSALRGSLQEAAFRSHFIMTLPRLCTASPIFVSHSLHRSIFKSPIK
jgi:hypothetical protein